MFDNPFYAFYRDGQAYCLNCLVATYDDWSYERVQVLASGESTDFGNVDVIHEDTFQFESYMGEVTSPIP